MNKLVTKSHQKVIRTIQSITIKRLVNFDNKGKNEDIFI